MKVKFTVVRGPHEGAVFEFSAHDTLIVGRSPEAHHRLPVKDKALSRVHFMIEVNPPSCRIMDMASTNGTFVNGRRVTIGDLKDGDIVKGGLTVLRVAFEPGRSPRVASEVLMVMARVAFEAESQVLTESGSPDAQAPETVDVVAGPFVLPRYRIESELGRGGMGIVYLARGVADAQPVALKTIAPRVACSTEAVARFLREASLLRRLDHPHVVGFREIGHAGGLLYYVMEYVPGTNAEALLQRQGGRLPIGRAVDWACQLLEGLSHAHSLGIVHRDVKPSNLLVGSVGGRDLVKVSDFGFARLYQDSPMSGLTLAGQVSGTFGFMAPEQISNFRDARPPADQYGAGATLYCLLTSCLPFDLPSRVEEQLLMILQDDPVPLQTRRAEVPIALVAAVHRALARDPADRFSDVAAFREALLPFRDGP